MSTPLLHVPFVFSFDRFVNWAVCKTLDTLPFVVNLVLNFAQVAFEIGDLLTLAIVAMVTKWLLDCGGHFGGYLVSLFRWPCFELVTSGHGCHGGSP